MKKLNSLTSVAALLAFAVTAPVYAAPSTTTTAEPTTKMAEAKCGASKSQTSKSSEGKCGTTKAKASKSAEGKCGEAKCGASKKR